MSRAARDKSAAVETTKKSAYTIVSEIAEAVSAEMKIPIVDIDRGAFSEQTFTSGPLTFDLIYGGGLPIGGWVSVIGPPMSGKTTIVVTIIAVAQRLKVPQIVFDCEGCLTGDTYVVSDRGVVRVSDLVESTVAKVGFYNKNYRLASVDGLRQATRWYCGGRKPIRRVTTQRGFEIGSSPAHKFLVLDCGCSLSWKSAADLVPGDHVAIQHGMQKWPSSYPSFKYRPVRTTARGSWIKYDTPKAMSTELAHILGSLVSDGHVRRTGCIEFSSSDQESVNHYAQCWTGCFPNAPLTSSHNETDGVSYIWCNSVYLAGFFASLGILLDATSYEQLIPDCVLQSPKDCVTAFLSSYFDGDGCVTADQILCTTASETLARQLSMLLLNLGAMHSVRREREIYYCVSVNGRHATLLAKQLSLNIRRKELARQRLARKSTSRDLSAVPKLKAALVVIKRRQYAPGRYVVNGKRLQLGLGKPNTTRDVTYDYLHRKAEKMCASLRTLGESRLATTIESVLEFEPYWDKVVSVDNQPPASVYDFHFPKETGLLPHAYWSNGFVSHNSQDPIYGKKIGAVFKKKGAGFHYVQVETGQDTYRFVRRMLKRFPTLSSEQVKKLRKPVAIFIIDSLASMLPDAIADNDENTQPARSAAMHSQYIPLVKKMLQKTGCTLIATNQLRINPMVRFGCLHSDTLVYFADGRSLPIKQVVQDQVGGEVWSWNEQAGFMERKTISAWHYNGEATEWLTLEVSQDQSRYAITVTPDHQLYTSRGLLPAKAVELGDRLLTVNGKYESVFLRLSPEKKDNGKYDITIEGNHNYSAGGKLGGVIVHNSPEVEPGGNAVQFYPDMRIRVSKHAPPKGKNEDEGGAAADTGKKMYKQWTEETALQGDGIDQFIWVSVRTLKNKHFAPFQDAQFRINIGKGIDPIYDGYEYLRLTGQVVTRGGGRYDVLLPGWEKEKLSWERLSRYVVTPEFRAACRAQITDGAAFKLYFQVKRQSTEVGEKGDDVLAVYNISDPESPPDAKSVKRHQHERDQHAAKHNQKSKHSRHR